MTNQSLEIILATGSPRRIAFFEQMGLSFTQRVIPVEEVFPEDLKRESIAEYLVKLKASPFEKIIRENQLVITADTIVWHKNQCLGKPKNRKDAERMLSNLSKKD